MLEHIVVVVAATFTTSQEGTVSLLNYLALVEQLQPRWKVLPKPWRSTFAVLVTRSGEALAWMIEVAHSLMVELKARGLESSIPCRIPPAHLNDPFIPDDAYSLISGLQIDPLHRDSAAPQEGGQNVPPLSGDTAGSYEQQIGPRYLNAAAALLPFISEMLREVNSSPQDELHSLYVSLLSLPDLFGDRVCRHHIMEYMEGIFERVRIASASVSSGQPTRQRAHRVSGKRSKGTRKGTGNRENRHS
jgi:hypothetical protein